MKSEATVREFSSKTMVGKGVKEGAYAVGALQAAAWLINMARFNEWSFWAEDTDGQAAIILSVVLIALVKAARNFMKERVIRPVKEGNPAGEWAVLVAAGVSAYVASVAAVCGLTLIVASTLGGLARSWMCFVVGAAVSVPFVRAVGMCGLALSVLVTSSGCASVAGKTKMDAGYTSITFVSEPETMVVDGEAVDLEPLTASVTVVLANDDVADVVAEHAGAIQEYSSFFLSLRVPAGVAIPKNLTDFVYTWSPDGSGSISVGSDFNMDSATQAAMIEAMTPTLTGMVQGIMEQLIAGGIL